MPGYDIYDGVDEHGRPLSDTELEARLQTTLKKRGRLAGSGTKEQEAIRFDCQVLAAFRAGGAEVASAFCIT